jgi:hypothetical protein
MTDKESNATRALHVAEYLEMRGDYVAAVRTIQEALVEDPSNKQLGKKHQDLLGIICWRC